MLYAELLRARVYVQLFMYDFLSLSAVVVVVADVYPTTRCVDTQPDEEKHSVVVGESFANSRIADVE